MVDMATLRRVGHATDGSRGGVVTTTGDGRLLVSQSNQVDVVAPATAQTVVATNPPADAQIALPQPFRSISFDQDMFVAAAGQAGSVLNPAYRSEERRGGKECGSTCRYRLSPHN